jgi:hypothetical protein
LAPLHRQRIGISSSSALKRHRSRAAATPWTSRSWRRRRGEDGRRFVPPVERPSAGVAAKKGVSDPACGARMRPRAVHGVAHASRVGVDHGDGRRPRAGPDRACDRPRNGDRFPDGRATRPRVECAADSGTVRPTTLAAISRRSGFDFSGAHRARQGFARSARRVRGFDPPGVLPSGWHLPDRRGDKRPSTRAPLTDRKGGGATLGVGWVRTEGGDRASDRSQRTADPRQS